MEVFQYLFNNNKNNNNDDDKEKGLNSFIHNLMIKDQNLYSYCCLLQKFYNKLRPYYQQQQSHQNSIKIIQHDEFSYPTICVLNNIYYNPQTLKWIFINHHHHHHQQNNEEEDVSECIKISPKKSIKSISFIDKCKSSSSILSILKDSVFKIEKERDGITVFIDDSYQQPFSSSSININNISIYLLILWLEPSPDTEKLKWVIETELLSKILRHPEKFTMIENFDEKYLTPWFVTCFKKYELFQKFFPILVQKKLNQYINFLSQLSQSMRRSSSSICITVEEPNQLEKFHMLPFLITLNHLKNYNLDEEILPKLSFPPPLRTSIPKLQTKLQSFYLAKSFSPSSSSSSSFPLSSSSSSSTSTLTTTIVSKDYESFLNEFNNNDNKNNISSISDILQGYSLAPTTETNIGGKITKTVIPDSVALLDYQQNDPNKTIIRSYDLPSYTTSEILELLNGQNQQIQNEVNFRTQEVTQLTQQINDLYQLLKDEYEQADRDNVQLMFKRIRFGGLYDDNVKLMSYFGTTLEGLVKSADPQFLASLPDFAKRKIIWAYRTFNVYCDIVRKTYMSMDTIIPPVLYFQQFPIGSTSDSLIRVDDELENNDVYNLSPVLTLHNLIGKKWLAWRSNASLVFVNQTIDHNERQDAMAKFRNAIYSISALFSTASGDLDHDMMDFLIEQWPENLLIKTMNLDRPEIQAYRAELYKYIRGYFSISLSSFKNWCDNIAFNLGKLHRLPFYGLYINYKTLERIIKEVEFHIKMLTETPSESNPLTVDTEMFEERRAGAYQYFIKSSTTFEDTLLRVVSEIMKAYHLLNPLVEKQNSFSLSTLMYRKVYFPIVLSKDQVKDYKVPLKVLPDIANIENIFSIDSTVRGSIFSQENDLINNLKERAIMIYFNENFPNLVDGENISLTTPTPSFLNNGGVLNFIRSKDTSLLGQIYNALNPRKEKMNIIDVMFSYSMQSVFQIANIFLQKYIIEIDNQRYQKFEKVTVEDDNPNQYSFKNTSSFSFSSIFKSESETNDPTSFFKLEMFPKFFANAFKMITPNPLNEKELDESSIFVERRPLTREMSINYGIRALYQLLRYYINRMLLGMIRFIGNDQNKDQILNILNRKQTKVSPKKDNDNDIDNIPSAALIPEEEEEQYFYTWEELMSDKIDFDNSVSPFFPKIDDDYFINNMDISLMNIINIFLKYLGNSSVFLSAPPPPVPRSRPSPPSSSSSLSSSSSSSSSSTSSRTNLNPPFSQQQLPQVKYISVIPPEYLAQQQNLLQEKQTLLQNNEKLLLANSKLSEKVKNLDELQATNELQRQELEQSRKQLEFLTNLQEAAQKTNQELAALLRDEYMPKIQKLEQKITELKSNQGFADLGEAPSPPRIPIPLLPPLSSSSSSSSSSSIPQPPPPPPISLLSQTKNQPLSTSFLGDLESIKLKPTPIPTNKELETSDSDLKVVLEKSLEKLREKVKEGDENKEEEDDWDEEDKNSKLVGAFLHNDANRFDIIPNIENGIIQHIFFELLMLGDHHVPHIMTTLQDIDPNISKYVSVWRMGMKFDFESHGSIPQLVRYNVPRYESITGAKQIIRKHNDENIELYDAQNVNDEFGGIYSKVHLFVAKQVQYLIDFYMNGYQHKNDTALHLNTIDNEKYNMWKQPLTGQPMLFPLCVVIYRRMISKYLSSLFFDNDEMYFYDIFQSFIQYQFYRFNNDNIEIFESMEKLIQDKISLSEGADVLDSNRIDNSLKEVYTKLVIPFLTNTWNGPWTSYWPFIYSTTPDDVGYFEKIISTLFVNNIDKERNVFVRQALISCRDDILGNPELHLNILAYLFPRISFLQQSSSNVSWFDVKKAMWSLTRDVASSYYFFGNWLLRMEYKIQLLNAKNNNNQEEEGGGSLAILTFINPDLIDNVPKTLFDGYANTKQTINKEIDTNINQSEFLKSFDYGNTKASSTIKPYSSLHQSDYLFSINRYYDVWFNEKNVKRFENSVVEEKMLNYLEHIRCELLPNFNLIRFIELNFIQKLQNIINNVPLSNIFQSTYLDAINSSSTSKKINEATETIFRLIHDISEKCVSATMDTILNIFYIFHLMVFIPQSLSKKNLQKSSSHSSLLPPISSSEQPSSSSSTSSTSDNPSEKELVITREELFNNLKSIRDQITTNNAINSIEQIEDILNQGGIIGGLEGENAHRSINDKILNLLNSLPSNDSTSVSNFKALLENIFIISNSIYVGNDPKFSKTIHTLTSGMYNLIFTRFFSQQIFSNISFPLSSSTPKDNDNEGNQKEKEDVDDDIELVMLKQKHIDQYMSSGYESLWSLMNRMEGLVMRFRKDKRTIIDNDFCDRMNQLLYFCVFSALNHSPQKTQTQTRKENELEYDNILAGWNTLKQFLNQSETLPITYIFRSLNDYRQTTIASGLTEEIFDRFYEILQRLLTSPTDDIRIEPKSIIPIINHIVKTTKGMRKIMQLYDNTFISTIKYVIQKCDNSQTFFIPLEFISNLSYFVSDGWSLKTINEINKNYGTVGGELSFEGLESIYNRIYVEPAKQYDLDSRYHLSDSSFIPMNILLPILNNKKKTNVDTVLINYLQNLVSFHVASISHYDFQKYIMRYAGIYFNTPIYDENLSQYFMRYTLVQETVIQKILNLPSFKKSIGNILQNPIVSEEINGLLLEEMNTKHVDRLDIIAKNDLYRLLIDPIILSSSSSSSSSTTNNNDNEYIPDLYSNDERHTYLHAWANRTFDKPLQSDADVILRLKLISFRKWMIYDLLEYIEKYSENPKLAGATYSSEEEINVEDFNLYDDDEDELINTSSTTKRNEKILNDNDLTDDEYNIPSSSLSTSDDDNEKSSIDDFDSSSTTVPAKFESKSIIQLIFDWCENTLRRMHIKNFYVENRSDRSPYNSDLKYLTNEKIISDMERQQLFCFIERLTFAFCSIRAYHFTSISDNNNNQNKNNMKKDYYGFRGIVKNMGRSFTPGYQTYEKIFGYRFKTTQKYRYLYPCTSPYINNSIINNGIHIQLAKSIINQQYPFNEKK